MSALEPITATTAKFYWSAVNRTKAAGETRLSATLIDEVRHQAELLEKAAQAAESDGAHTAWAEWQRQIRQGLISGDLSKFLTWPAVAYTMFVRFGPYVRDELKAFRGDSEWKSRWQPALREDALGCPLPCLIYPASSANLIHHTFHVRALEHAFQRRIDSFDEVIEFGGGYGGFVRTLRRLGFRGDVQIFDFPELGLLQQFYLAALSQAPNAGPLAGVMDSVSFVDNKSNLQSPKPNASSLFVAMWSLSETPTEFREDWVDVIRGCSHVVIGFQKRFYDVDNSDWFRKLSAQLNDFEWTTQELAKGRDCYLFGTRR